MIGQFSFSNSNIPKEIEIGKFTSIGEHTQFLIYFQHPSVLNNKIVTNFPFADRKDDFKDEDFKNFPKCGPKQGKLIIGNDVWIGNNVLFVSPIKVHDGAIIAAGSVITKEVPPYAIVAGNPAQIKQFRFNPNQIKALLEIKWWNWNHDKIKERIKDFLNIDEFIKKYDTTNAWYW